MQKLSFLETSTSFTSVERGCADKRTALDFWKWGFSDLRQNITRGILAEYIVAWAIGADKRPRQSWAAYDLESPSGKKVEVKCTSYLQAWTYTKKINPKFDIKPSKPWSADEGMGEEKGYNADIYVLCYFFERDRDKADPMNLDQWKFWIFSKKNLISLLNTKKSLTASYLESNCESFSFYQLSDAIV